MFEQSFQIEKPWADTNEYMHDISNKNLLQQHIKL